MQHWTPGDVIDNFAQAKIQYFTYPLLETRAREDGPVDMPGFFERQRRVIVAAFVGICLVAMINNYLYPQQIGLPASIWKQEDAIILANLVPFAVAAFARRS